MEQTPLGRDKIGIFTIAMITAAFVLAIRNWPVMAESGLQALFFCALAAFIFLIPVSLCSAELATGWPKEGGVYVWVKEAFGKRAGFLAIWLQWAENVIWIPTALAFLASTLAYTFAPELANNRWYLISIILLIYWITTFLNLQGLKVSGWISTLGVIVGVFLPGAFIICLAAFYLLAGHPIQLTLGDSSKFFPDFTQISNLAIFGFFIFSFSGIEASAVYAQDVRNPKKNYQIAIFLTAFLLLILNVIGTLSIAIVIPQKDVSLTAGIMDATKLFLGKFGLDWLLPVMALTIVIGALGQISTWMVGPCMGLMVTSQEGELPKVFLKVTKHGMPKNLLIVQGIVVTLLCALFVFMPTINSSYWALGILSVILYLVMYLLLFFASIRLRYTHPHIPRSYMVPGGKVGMWCVAGFGILASLFTLFTSFFPPKQLPVGDILSFELFLVGGSILFIALPFIIYRPKGHLIGK